MYNNQSGLSWGQEEKNGSEERLMEQDRISEGQTIQQDMLSEGQTICQDAIMGGQSVPADSMYVENARYVPSKYNKGKKPVLSIILTFLIMLAFMGIQVVVIVPFVISGLYKNLSDLPQTAVGSMSEEQLMDTMLGSVDTIELTIIATFVSMIAAIIWYRLAYCRGYGIQELKKSCKRIFTVRTVSGIVLSAICLFYFCNVIVFIFEKLWPSALEEYNSLIESSGLITLDWKMIILTVVMAPINEECIMRGLIFTNLKKNMAPVYAIIISGIYFGIFHMNWVQGTYAAILGFYMAYVAYKYKSIIASMLLHAVFNGLNYILALLPDSFNESTAVSILVPIITGVLWYFIDGKRKIKDID